MITIVFQAHKLEFFVLCYNPLNFRTELVN